MPEIKVKHQVKCHRQQCVFDEHLRILYTRWIHVKSSMNFKYVYNAQQQQQQHQQNDIEEITEVVQENGSVAITYATYGSNKNFQSTVLQYGICNAFLFHVPSSTGSGRIISKIVLHVRCFFFCFKNTSERKKLS